MIWILPAIAGLLILFFAARFSRFRHVAEPVLTLAVALGLIGAFIVWFSDDNKSASPLLPTVENGPALRPEQIVLSNMIAVQGTTATSYRVSGTVFNNSEVALDYFTLTATLQDCPQNPCKTLGSDSDLILARLPAGKTQSFTTFFTIANPTLLAPVAASWSYSVSNAKPLVAR